MPGEPNSSSRSTGITTGRSLRVVRITGVAKAWGDAGTISANVRQGGLQLVATILPRQLQFSYRFGRNGQTQEIEQRHTIIQGKEIANGSLSTSMPQHLCP